MANFREAALYGPFALTGDDAGTVCRQEKRRQEAFPWRDILRKTTAVEIRLQEIDNRRRLLDFGREPHRVRITVVRRDDKLPTAPEFVDELPESVVHQLLARQLEKLGRCLIADVNLIIDVGMPDRDTMYGRDVNILKRRRRHIGRAGAAKQLERTGLAVVRKGRPRRRPEGTCEECRIGGRL